MAKVSSSSSSGASRPRPRSSSSSSSSRKPSSTSSKATQNKTSTSKSAEARSAGKVGQADKVNLSREARKPGESGGADAGHLSALMSNYGGGTTSSNAGNAGKPESAGVSSVGSVSSTGNGTQAGNAAGNGTPGNGTQTGNAAGNGTPGNGTQAGNTAGNGTPGNGTQPANAGGNGTADAPPETRPGSGFLPAPVRDRDLWSVPNSEWNQLEGGGRYRSWTAGDDRGPWTEVERGGQNWRTRSYTENGTNWSETIMEGNHWRYREGGMEGLTREAEARGVTTFQLPGPDGRPLDIRVAGGASPQELARVRQSIEAMPAQARIHARNIVLSDNLGQVFGQGMVPSNGATGVGAMAGNREGRMVLDRHGLTSNQATNYLIHHEAGHNLAASSGYPETSELWRSLPGSVSPYGGRSGAEDFAETHRYVMGNWDSYVNSGAVPLAQSGNRPVRGNGPLGIERTPSAAKAMEILRLYGWKGPESGV